MGLSSSERISWVASQIVPHEAGLRTWLARTGMPHHEIDDIVQDAYVRITKLDAVAHIQSPRSYLFTVARSALISKLRHERVVRIDLLCDIETLEVEDTSPGPERQVSGRQELEVVGRMIDALPERCRAVFRLRRIEGLSQKDIARRLGMSEHVVEQQAMRALKLLTAMLTEAETETRQRPRAEKGDRDEPRRN